MSVSKFSAFSFGGAFGIPTCVTDEESRCYLQETSEQIQPFYLPCLQVSWSLYYDVTFEVRIFYTWIKVLFYGCQSIVDCKRIHTLSSFSGQMLSPDRENTRKNLEWMQTNDLIWTETDIIWPFRRIWLPVVSSGIKLQGNCLLFYTF